MNLPVFIGIRYTGTRQPNQLVSFLSRISMMGLVVGVALLILVLSIMNGFERELRDRILGVLPQATLYHREGIDDWRELQTMAEAHPDVIAAAPFIEVQGLASNKGTAKPIIIYGIDPTEEMRVSKIADFVPAEVLNGLNTDESNIILGAAIAEKLELNVGEQVMLVVPDDTDASATPTVRYFTLKNIISTQTEIDQSLALMSMHDADALTSAEGVSGLHLKVVDLFEARRIVWELVMDLGVGYYGSSWVYSHGNLYQAIKTSKSLVGLLMSLIVAIAAFNVVSTLVMVVVEKQGDIAILRTLGASTRDIMMIFIVQGASIGAIGTFIGVLVGLGLSVIVQDVVAFFEGLLGVQFLQSDVYPLTYLPTKIVAADIVQVVFTAMILSLLATLYPAWRASKTNPAEALRYE